MTNGKEQDFVEQLRAGPTCIPELALLAEQDDDPRHYRRFGFQPTVKYGIKGLEPIPDEYVMVCPLAENALAGITGTVRLG